MSKERKKFRTGAPNSPNVNTTKVFGTRTIIRARMVKEVPPSMISFGSSPNNSAVDGELIMKYSSDANASSEPPVTSNVSMMR